VSGAREQFRLPDLGEGLPEAELVQWTVAVGDRVALNQTIAEVETAKAVVELPSPHAGVVRELHAAAGDTIEVGSVIITFDVDAPAGPDAGAEPDADAVSGADPDAAPSADPDAGAQPNLVGYGAAPRASGAPRRRARVARRAAVADTAVLEAAPHDVLRESPGVPRESPGVPRESLGLDDRAARRPRSTPPVRMLARSLGIDLLRVPGTGPNGLVTRTDVEAFAAGADTSHTVARADETGDVRIPIRGVRRRTAEAMVRSAFTAPHVTVFLTVDVTATMQFIASLKDDRAVSGHRIGVLAVAAKAVCLALRAHPELNSSWDEDAGEIVQYARVNLGIAAATERGLVVPNIAGADAMTLPELADAIGELAATARAGRTAPGAMSGGTFTITNVGVFGVDAGTPILNPGEAGILALGAVTKRPWEYDGQIALRDVTTLALSFDHRLVDGQQGALFLAEVGGVLRDPGRALLLA